MKRLATCGLLLAAATLAASTGAAVPAHASLTPVSTAFVASSFNSVLIDEGTGLRTRCPAAVLGGPGSTSADGRSISAEPDFYWSDGVTCTESLFGSSVIWSCSGNFTFRSTSSVARTSASGTLTLDSGFSCTITSLAGTRTIRGPQTPSNCTWTFTPPSTLRTACNTIVTSSGESGFAATYRTTNNFSVS